MNWRGPLIGLVIVLALAAAVVFVQRRDAREGRREQAELVFPYNTRDVVALRVEHELGTAEFRRDGDGWQRVAGSEAARPELVPEVLASWSRVRFIDVLEENPGEDELARFGLAPPAATYSAELVAERAAGRQGRSPRIEVGGPLPLSPGFYARVDGFPRVVAVSPEAIDLVVGVGRELFGEESTLPVDDDDDHGH
ncbi:MAG: hypothetical protein Kow0062_15240 [Acidobacteriota bacterium]